MSLKSEIWFEAVRNIQIDGHPFKKMDQIYSSWDQKWEPFQVIYTAEQWRSLQRKHVGLRLKYQEVKDSPVLIGFQGRGPWLTPEQFVRDYFEEQLKKLDETYDFFGRIPNGVEASQQRYGSKTMETLEAAGFGVGG